MPEKLLNETKVAELRLFISMLEKNPDAIHAPELEFFKSYLIKLGATIPASSKKTFTEPQTKHEEMISEDEPDTEDDECVQVTDDDSDDPGRMEPDSLSAQYNVEERFGELTEAEEERLIQLKEKVADHMETKEYEKARNEMTEILKLGNPSAMMYAKRAEINLRLKCPLACIEDCNKALKHNPDNGKAYRLRGCAYRALGQWEQAHRDLEQGQKIDFDETLDDVQKFVETKWKKIDQARREKDRRREERKRRNTLRERRRRQAAARKAYEMETAKDQDYPEDDIDDADDTSNTTFADNFDSGAPGGGGLEGFLGGLMGNPEMKKAMSNPKILQAVMEMMQNPASFSKYQNDPEIMSAFTSLMSSMKGAGACCGRGPNACGSTGCSS